MARAVMQPITASETMRLRTDDGLDMAKEAAAFIKPNDRLTAFERLEIYNRQYWFRIFAAFEEDFPGLQAVAGRRAFEKLMRAYLKECPSESYTLRNLGSRLEAWLRANPAYVSGHVELALDMVRLEWAHIESFDAAERVPIAPEQMAMVGPHSRLKLQPHIRLLAMQYPVDELLLALKHDAQLSDTSSNNATALRRGREVRKAAALKPQAIWLAVHRHGNTIYYKRLCTEEFGVLSGLNEGLTLEQAIEHGCKGSELDANEAPAMLQSMFTTWAMLQGFCSPE